MEHVNTVLSAQSNLEHSQTLRQIFEDALKDGNSILFENIQIAEIQDQEMNRLLVWNN